MERVYYFVIVSSWRSGSGGPGPDLWTPVVNMLRPPTQFADRAALYHWRDTLGVPREQAYAQLMQACGPQQLECRLGPAQGRIIQEDWTRTGVGDGNCDGV